MSKTQYTLENRPLCSTPGCKNTCYYIRFNRKTGNITWRKVCPRCHNRRTAEKHGLKTIMEVVAKKAGFASVTEYLNSKHPYRSKRKTYCENRDGRLGFKCNYRVKLPLINGKRFLGHLSVDHINGNPYDHSDGNLQTLCTCCHAFKTALYGDALTPGRKFLKTTKSLKIHN